MSTALQIPETSDAANVDWLVAALSVVATSASIIENALIDRGGDPDDAREEAESKTADYFATTLALVRAARAGGAYSGPYDLRALALAGYRVRDVRLLALAGAWAARKGTPNMLVRPFVN